MIIFLDCKVTELFWIGLSKEIVKISFISPEITFRIAVERSLFGG